MEQFDINANRFTNCIKSSSRFSRDTVARETTDITINFTRCERRQKETRCLASRNKILRRYKQLYKKLSDWCRPVSKLYENVRCCDV